MIRLIALALCVSACAFGQLQLFVAPPGEPEQAIAALFDLGRTNIGDSSATRFRIRNVGSATITLSTLEVSGAGFSMTGAPSRPHLVAPGTNVDFTIHFRPADYGNFSANLQLNSFSVLLRASGMAAAAFYYNGQPLPSGSTLDFGRAERGEQQTVSIEARNTTRESVVINTIELTGGIAFELDQQNPAPFVIEPAGSRPITIRFRPNNNQIFTATLVIDGTRKITLTGTGLEPPMPRPAIVIESAAVRSGEQGRIVVQMSSVSRASGRGLLKMELKPAGEIKDNDAAAQFVSGSRTAAFAVSEGSADVAFDGSRATTIVFQAGTTAGQLTFTVEAGGYTERATVVIPPEPVRLDKSLATRNGSAIDIQLAGFDNSRSAGELLFTFYGSSGQPLTSTPIRIAAAEDFGKWWASSTLGGIFSLRASFPISGDATQVKAVEVQLVNSAGTVKTDRLSF